MVIIRQYSSYIICQYNVRGYSSNHNIPHKNIPQKTSLTLHYVIPVQRHKININFIKYFIMFVTVLVFVIDYKMLLEVVLYLYDFSNKHK
jgi:hypothetical protein